MDTMKVKLENIKTGQFPVTVETVGEVQSGYAIGTKIPTPNIVEVSGPESLVKRINQVRVTVNVQGLASSQTFSAEPAYYNYDGDKLDSSRLTCNVKKVEVSVNLLQTKKVELKVKTTGDVAKGYQLESVLLEPKTITVAGTKEQLADLSEILVSNLSVEGLKDDTEENIDITSYLPEGIKLAQDSPDVRVKIQVVPLDVNTITIPTNKITVKNQDMSLNLSFAEESISVTIRGEQEAIGDLKLEDLNPTIDLTDLGEGDHQVQLEVKDLKDAYYENIPKIKISLKAE